MSLNQILSFILLYKYFALFIITFFGSFLNITPASPTLIASGSLIAKGYLNYYQVFIIGLLGSAIGDISAYLLSYHYSREVLEKIGFKKLLNSKNFKKVENIFKKNSAKLMFFSRFFLTSFGPIVNLIAGLEKVNYKKFIFYDVMGETIYVFSLTGIGYLFANNWEYISKLWQYYSGIILIIFIIIALIFYFRRKRIFFRK